MEYNAKSDKETVARLVLGYLKTECRSAYKVFLKSRFSNKGKHIVTRIAGQSLEDILKVYGQIYETVQSRLEETNYYTENTRDHASPFYLSQQLLYLLENNAHYTPASTPCPRSPTDSVAPTVDENPYSVQSNQPPSSSEIETTPEEALPGNVQWQCASENSYFCKTPKRRPTSPKLSKSTNPDKLPMPDTEVKEVMSEVTQALLKNKEFHKTLANNINFVLNAGDMNEEALRDLASAELDAKIQNVMRKTEEDPSFDEVVETLLVNTPIAESISKAIEEGNATPTTSHPHQNAYKTPALDFYQTNNIQMYSSSSSVTSNSVVPETSKSNNVIIYNGSLENYVKTSNYDNINNTLNTPYLQNLQNPLCVNTGNIVIMPQGLVSTTGATYQYANADTKQYYVLNQPVAQPVVVQPVDRQLTEAEILAMPTVILNDTKKQNVKKDATKKCKTVLPKFKVEVASSLKEYLNLYDVNKESPNIKLGLQKVIPPKASTSQGSAANLTAQPLPILNNQQKAKVLETEKLVQTNTATVKTQTSDTEQTVPNVTNKEPEIVETVKENKKSSQRSIKSLSNIRTPSPGCSTAKKPTPKSGSHIRTLKFLTPPKVKSSSQKKLDHANRTPNFVHKKQAAKTLFKPKTDDEQHEEKENGKTEAKTKIRKPWDSNIRAQLRLNRDKSPDEKSRTPPKMKKRREKKIIKRQLNTTDQDGLLIENALKSPEHNEAHKETKISESITIIEDPVLNQNDTGTSEPCPKTILSPSKLNVNKKILKTEANVISKDDITPVLEKPNIQYPVSAKRNITFLPETTPSKEDFDFKTGLTPGFSTMTPMTQLLKANGINDSLGIDTPNFPLTPGTFLTQEPSPYYEPDEMPDKLEENIMETDVQQEKTRSLINILSDVTVKPSITEAKKEKSGIALSDHLRKFNHNIIGKKNLNLMSRDEHPSDVSTSSSSSSSSSDSSEEGSDSDGEETNETVICRTENDEKVIETTVESKAIEPIEESEVLEPKTRSGYALRARKKSTLSTEVGKGKCTDVQPKNKVTAITEEIEETSELNNKNLNKSEGAKETLAVNTFQNKIHEQVKTSDYIKQVISTINLKDTAAIHNKLKLSTPKKAVLSDLEAKRLRMVSLLKEPQNKKRKNEEVAKPKEVVTRTKPNNLQTRRRSRKSDSPKKVLSNNNQREKILKNNASNKDDAKQNSVPKQPDEISTLQVESSDKDIFKENYSKTNSQPNQNNTKSVGDSKDNSGSKDFFPDLSSEEEEDQNEKEQLVAGLKERGIHLVPNKSPKKKLTKPIQHSKICEPEIIPPPFSPSFQSVKNDFEVVLFEEKDYITMVFDESKKGRKRLEDYNLTEHERNKVITFRIEAHVGDVDVRLSCQPVQSLLDIESALVNVLIPKRNRLKPSINVDKEKDDNKDASRRNQSVDEVDNKVALSTKQSTILAEACKGILDDDCGPESIVDDNVVIVDDCPAESRLKQSVAKATPSHSGKCSERSEGYDDLMNFAVVGSGPEESGEDTVKSVQDVCLILALAILLLTFFSTYVFQTGLVYLLYERFKATLIMCMAYFVMTTVLHIWSLIVRWNNLKYSWSVPFLLFFIIHRFTAALYYYYYKRASLRISDPRFYEDIDMRQSSGEIN